MDFRNFLESVTIGHIDSGIDNKTLVAAIIIGMLWALAQFVVGLVYDYKEKEVGPPLKWHTNLVFLLPLLLLVSSLELIILVLFTFNSCAFAFVGIGLGVYHFTKFMLFITDEHECMLGLTSWVQKMGVKWVTKYPYLFQGIIERYKSMRYVHKQQKNYLKRTL